jgi:MOSC domain-containing protein YiiM
MSIVLVGGIVSVGDAIEIELPSPPHCSLEKV